VAGKGFADGEEALESGCKMCHCADAVSRPFLLTRRSSSSPIQLDLFSYASCLIERAASFPSHFISSRLVWSHRIALHCIVAIPLAAVVDFEFAFTSALALELAVAPLIFTALPCPSLPPLVPLFSILLFTLLQFTWTRRRRHRSTWPRGRLRAIVCRPARLLGGGAESWVERRQRRLLAQSR